MESLSSFISCWWEDKLSTDNTSFRTDAIQKKNDSLYYMRQTSADMMNISSSFDDIKNDEKYEVYFAHYHDPAYAESMHDKLTSFYASC